jgi:hypothetical protein
MHCRQFSANSQLMNNEAHDTILQAGTRAIHVPSVLDQTAKQDIARQMCDRWEAAVLGVKKADTLKEFLDGSMRLWMKWYRDMTASLPYDVLCVFLQFGHHKVYEIKAHESVDLAPDLLMFAVLADEPEVKLVLDEELKSLEKQLQHKPEDFGLRADLGVKVTELEHAYRGICFNSLHST